ncbi:hypothetical protein AXW84_21330 [Hymenobacter sp. PAMC 26628]|nr:hypothetical protein AXW84_21330 [Hymenobacter sp. PAMC 26628]
MVASAQRFHGCGHRLHGSGSIVVTDGQAAGARRVVPSRVGIARSQQAHRHYVGRGLGHLLGQPVLVARPVQGRIAMQHNDQHGRGRAVSAAVGLAIKQHRRRGWPPGLGPGPSQSAHHE